MSFYRSGGPGKAETGVDGGAIRLDAMRQTDERGKFAGNRIIQPGVQVANATPCNKSAEALEQTVADRQPFVLFQRSA